VFPPEREKGERERKMTPFRSLFMKEGGEGEGSIRGRGKSRAAFTIRRKREGGKNHIPFLPSRRGELGEGFILPGKREKEGGGENCLKPPSFFVVGEKKKRKEEFAIGGKRGEEDLYQIQ